MPKSKSLEDFYLDKFEAAPEGVKHAAGHFNVFGLDEFVGENCSPMPFDRREYYKISFIKGIGNKVNFADKVMRVKRHAVLFSNPMIPYNWENIDPKTTGFFCIFSASFFSQYGQFLEYPVFQPGGSPLYEVSEEMVSAIEDIYLKMLEENASDFDFKFDALRSLTMQLAHLILKGNPSEAFDTKYSNASTRIKAMFLELLDRQFPINSPKETIDIKSNTDFASQLNIHVNHLNRALKEVTQKTTSIIIAERFTKEAKILLRHSNWNISEIAHCLGFKEASHFSNFFKKQTQETPSQYRRLKLV